MEQQIELTVEAREERGKNAARRLRAAGKVPASLYGLGQEAEALALNAKKATRILASREDRNRILNLAGAVDGLAMAYDYQVDPVSGALLHVDLIRVALDKPIEVELPVVTTGVAYGVKNEGGMEDQILRRIKARCLPAATPAKIEVDVAPLRAGDSVRLGDLETPDDVELLGAASAVVVRIVGKRAGGLLDQEAEEEEAAAAAEGAESEESAESEEAADAE